MLNSCKNKVSHSLCACVLRCMPGVFGDCPAPPETSHLKRLIFLTTLSMQCSVPTEALTEQVTWSVYGAPLLINNTGRGIQNRPANMVQSLL